MNQTHNSYTFYLKYGRRKTCTFMMKVVALLKNMFINISISAIGGIMNYVV